MATILKCDRCGAESKDLNKVEQLVTNMTASTTIVIPGAERALKLDLCVLCRKTLVSFLERLPESSNE